MQKRYWLRGGVIGIIVNLILSFGLFIVALTVHDISDAYGATAEAISNFIGNILLYEPLSKGGFSGSEILIISLIYSFLIGGFMGWLYEKIKNRPE